MLKVAIVGSREHPDPSVVVPMIYSLTERYGREGWMLVSGGAPGVCERAERTAQDHWVTVMSFRPYQVAGDEWRARKWTLGQYPSVETLQDPHPCWASFSGAAFYRSLLIAQEADKALVYWNGRSRGTQHEIDFFAAANVPTYIYRSDHGEQE